MVGFTINDHRIRAQLRYSPNLNCYSVRFNAARQPNSVARRTVSWIKETKLVEERRYQPIANTSFVIDKLVFYIAMSQGYAQSFVGNNTQWYCEKIYYD